MSVYPRAETAKAAGQPATGVPAQPSFPELEEGVLAYWAANDTFEESVRQRPADNEFVFYDGLFPQGKWLRIRAEKESVSLLSQVKLTVDRPFLFFIRDVASNTVITRVRGGCACSRARQGFGGLAYRASTF